MRAPIVRCLIALASFFPGPGLAQNLRVATERADAVVVGRISAGVNRADGVTFQLTVVRSLDGEAQPGQGLAVDAKLRVRGYTAAKREVQGQCGLFPLRRTESAWEVLGSDNSPSLSSAYVPPLFRLGSARRRPRNSPMG